MAPKIIRGWTCELDQVDARLEAMNTPKNPDHKWQHDTTSDEAKHAHDLGRARLVCVCLATPRAEKAAKAAADKAEAAVKAAVAAKIEAAVKAAKAEATNTSVSPTSETPGGAGGKAPSKAADSKANKPATKKKR